MKRRLNELLLTLPSFAWLTVFFVFPAAIVMVLAFKPSDPLGGVAAGWTLDQLKELGDEQYLPILWRTLWLSGATTFLCLALAVPMSFGMARIQGPLKHVLILLVIVPFWTNFLIRVFAWKALLHPQGLISRALQSCGIIEDGAVLLDNDYAVLLVMVYTQLPFAILPLFAAADKFDFGLLEAARDLGASSFRAFRSVFLPAISSGIGAAALMVFVCTLGMYVVPDVVGGTDTEMIGNKIAQRVQSDRNLPLASALSAALLVGVSFLMIGAWWWRNRDQEPKEANP
jgi:spermidine/putrescine transport system permease protein